MARCVVKFGGSSFKAAGDMLKILQALRLYENPPVVVVSAFYGITNELIEILDSPTMSEAEIRSMGDRLKSMKRESLETHIDNLEAREAAYQHLRQRLDDLTRLLLGTHYIGEIPPFVRDHILSYGERFSSLIVTAILEYHGIPAMEGLPEDIGLFTDGEQGNAGVDFNASAGSVAASLPEDRVCVIPGFYGIGPEGRITLLGRGGSDYSAAAIARCVAASSLDVWKDVDGYLSGDPKSVHSPKRIPRLGYSEAAELSYFGAQILHPRTVEPLEEDSIPIRIFNIDSLSTSLKPLSVIGPDKEAPKGPKSITYTDDFAVLTLSGAGVGIKPGILARVTSALDKRGINIKSVVTSQTSINIYLDQANLEPTNKVVQSLELAALSHIVPRGDLSVVALVGDGLGEAPEIAAGMMEALGLEGVRFRIFSVGASDAAAYVVIPRWQRPSAVKALHDRYFA